MYICPTCGAEFRSQELITKHFLSCWKEQHPNHKSNPAPRSEDIEERIVNQSTLDFFASFEKGK